MVTTTSPAPRRPLGYGERLWLRLSEAASNNAIIIAQIVGPLDIQRLERAMYRAAQIHPLLRAHVEEVNGHPHYVFKPSPTLNWQVLPSTGHDDWKRVVTEELSNGIGPSEPVLWRITLLNGADQSDLILVSNHAIHDGLSHQIILDTILQGYGDDAHDVAPRLVADCYEQHLATSGLGRVLWQGIASMLRRGTTPHPRLIRTPVNPAYRPGQTLTTAFHTFDLDREATKTLIQAAKTRQQSLHGVLSSAFLLATRQALGPGSDRQVITLGAAINARPKLRRSFDRDVGYFASAVESRFPVEPDMNFWRLAADVNTDIQGKYTAETIAFSVFMKRIILRLKKNPQKLIDTVAKVAKTNIHLTNLGRLLIQPAYGERCDEVSGQGGGEQRGALKVNRVIAFPGVHFIPMPVVCLETHSFDGRIDFAFSWPAPITDPSFVSSLVSDFENRITCLIAQHAEQSTVAVTRQGQYKKGQHHDPAELQS